jgi:hypothetical protein
VTAAALLTSCSNGEDKRASASPPTTVDATTSSSSPSSSTSTVVPTTTTTLASRPTTTLPASSPEGHAKALYEAWTKGDRAAAEKVAQLEAVTALFARPWQPGDGWAFVECGGAAGSTICTWQRPSGRLLFRVQNATSGRAVAEVRFQP